MGRENPDRLHAVEPDMRLGPMTLRSHPEPKQPRVGCSTDRASQAPPKEGFLLLIKDTLKED